MQSRLMRVAAADALFICIGASTALGASVTQPGELVGIPAGTPLPPSLYFANTADWAAGIQLRPVASASRFRWRHMVGALDLPRRESAVLHGAPRDRDRRL
jgi:hypothetical protein